MSGQDWHRPQDVLPPNNEVVDTMDSAGHVQELKLMRNLWWFADGSMYVYYVPTFWKPKEAKENP